MLLSHFFFLFKVSNNISIISRNFRSLDSSSVVLKLKYLICTYKRNVILIYETL